MNLVSLSMKTLLPLRRKLAAGLFVTTLTLSIASFQPRVFAAEHEKHGKEGHGKAANYASSAEAWKAVQDATNQIEAHVTAKNLKPVHEAEEQLSAALVYFKGKAGITAAPNALAAAKKIHETSDAGDQEKTEKALQTLKAVLSQLEKQVAAK